MKMNEISKWNPLCSWPFVLQITHILKLSSILLKVTYYIILGRLPYPNVATTVCPNWPALLQCDLATPSPRGESNSFPLESGSLLVTLDHAINCPFLPPGRNADGMVGAEVQVVRTTKQTDWNMVDYVCCHCSCGLHTLTFTWQRNKLCCLAHLFWTFLSQQPNYIS